MVRSKQPPQQLNEIQQRRVQWNLNDGAGPANDQRDNAAGEVRQVEDAQPRDDGDDIALLINDELIDDDVNDVDFIPGAIGDPVLRPREAQWGRYAQVRFEDGGDDFVNDFDDEVVYLPRRRERVVREEVAYGEFKNVLDKSQFYAKVSKMDENINANPSKERDRNVFCHFGNVAFKLKDHVTYEDLHKIPCTEFWVYVSLEANNSAVYFEWNSDGSSKKSRQRKKAADNFHHYMIEGVLDVDLWQGLSTQRYFELRLESYDESTNEMRLSAFLKKGGLSELQHPSDIVQCNESLGVVVSYFFGVSMCTHTGAKNLKHDVEDLYSAIKQWHAEKEYSSVDVQHPSLIPQLRPYQKLAVKWMLHQEKFGQVKKEDTDSSCDLHCLFVEITSKDGVTLYFNRYGGFLVKDKPLAVLSTPGGILADEMGLGKTVEVLSCMLCHPRPDIQKPAYQEPISIQSQKTKCRRRSSKRLSGNDIFTLHGVLEEEGAGSSVMDDNFNDSISMDSGLGEMSENSQTYKNTRNVTKYETVASGEKEDSEIPRSRIKVHIPKRDTEEKYENLNKRGRPKRRAAEISSGYVSFDEDNDVEEDDYEPPQKKQAVRKTSQTKSGYNVEQEISDSTYWSSIESAIVKECWSGKTKEYRKEGSYKEFRKFLKMRKKDPYYMMSMKQRLELQYISSIAKYSAREVVNQRAIQGFFDTKVAQKSYFECLCGSAEIENRDDKFRVQCSVCSLWQHADCVQYDVKDPYRGPYICPHCWTQEKPVVSGATLIVTPFSISYQVSCKLLFVLVHVNDGTSFIFQRTIFFKERLHRRFV